MAEVEIKKAVFQMGANKAPGPDRIPAKNFQRYWNWVGSTIVQFVGEVFEKKEMPEEMNKSLICLLPKQVQPEHIS